MEKSGAKKIIKIEFKDGRSGESVLNWDSNREIIITSREELIDGACVSRSSKKGLCYIIDGLDNNGSNSPAKTFKRTFEMFILDVIDFDIPSFEEVLRTNWDNSNDYDVFIGIILLNETNKNYEAYKYILDKLLENKFWTDKQKIFIDLKPIGKKSKSALASDGEKFSPLHVRKYQFFFDSKTESAENYTTPICESVQNYGSTKSIQEILNTVCNKMEIEGKCVPTIGGTMNENEKYILKIR